MPRMALHQAIPRGQFQICVHIQRLIASLIFFPSTICDILSIKKYFTCLDPQQIVLLGMQCAIHSHLNVEQFIHVNCLLGPFIFTVVNLKKGPTIPIVLHTAWARALSAIVIVCPHKIKIHVIQIKLHTSLHRSCYQRLGAT